MLCERGCGRREWDIFGLNECGVLNAARFRCQWAPLDTIDRTISVRRSGQVRTSHARVASMVYWSSASPRIIVIVIGITASTLNRRARKKKSEERHKRPRPRFIHLSVVSRQKDIEKRVHENETKETMRCRQAWSGPRSCPFCSSSPELPL